MKPKDSLCMNRYMCILVAFLTLCGQTALSAQTYEQVLRRNFWNGSSNVAGIRQDSLSRSYAELSGGYETGGFKASWQAEDAWNAGARTASIRHLERISFKGAFSFCQWEGYGMCGSMFTDPGYYPVDVLEFTPGRKTLQTYALDGGFSYDVAPGWRIGAMADFTSANMAKRKDLRHDNWKLDFRIAPGFMFHKGDLAVGASYVFGKTAETVKAEQVGTAESSYYAFFDKGLMYGVYQVWTGSGVHLDEDGVNGLPVKEFSNGFALQAQYKGLFAELEYARTSGSVGEKEYIWFRFPGDRVDVRLGYKVAGRTAEHYARLDFGWKSQAVFESVLEKDTENGVTTVIGHGSNMIQRREILSLRPKYEYVAESWEAFAEAGFGWHNGAASQIYPYVQTQSLMKAEVRAGGLVRLAGVVELAADVVYGWGSVSEEDSQVAEDAGAQLAPYRLQEWYDLQMEYDTARRIGAGLSVKYDFWKGMYVKAAGRWLHGLGLQKLTGADRTEAKLAIGYQF